MRPTISAKRPYRTLAAFTTAALAAVMAQATGYGSINNFDCVNDTGVEAHGFEIEIDYGHTTDITYTYDYNHYGTPKIREDASDPIHPKVFVRYESGKNPDGTWKAYTAIPSGPIAPTMGHQFTNPAINFGGEHFGVGFFGNPTAVKYNWLLDDGAGNLILSAPVNISTPSYTYVPAQPAAPAQVVAAIVVPPPPAPPPLEFGPAQWVKMIKTTSHNQGKIKLEDLVGDDPGHAQPWANGEAAEVEKEWAILQTDFAAANGGANGELQGAPEALPHGDEVVTRRYEFYKYIGPYDAETGQAMADTVAADGIHGVGTVTYADHFDPAIGEWVTVTVDLSKVEVVGDFFGAQMAGFDVQPKMGLVAHLQDGDLGSPYPARTVVVPGGTPFAARVKSGSLPPGMQFDGVSGVLSGTPNTAGSYAFTIEATDLGATVTQAYTLNVAGAGPALVSVTADSAPAGLGGVTGAGAFNAGSTVHLQASPNAGAYFVNWTEGGVVVSTNPKLDFKATADRSLTANFAGLLNVVADATPALGGSVTGAGAFRVGELAHLKATAAVGYYFAGWSEGGTVVTKLPTLDFRVSNARNLQATFRPTLVVVAAQAPAGTGSITGDGTFKAGATVHLRATPNAGYYFVNWAENGTPVFGMPNYDFVASMDRNLVANFAPWLSVTAGVNIAGAGTVSGTGAFRSGQAVHLVATPAAGYKFVNWTEGGVVVSKVAALNFTANGNRTLTANFVVSP